MPSEGRASRFGTRARSIWRTCDVKRSVFSINHRGSWFSRSEWILIAALLAEVAIFSAIGSNFFSVGNLFEIVRLSIELGLLAVGLTPIIVSGGIDLSVGSMMGLAAVGFGAAYRDWHLPVAGAALVSLLLGCAGGGLNALLIARLG